MMRLPLLKHTLRHLQPQALFAQLKDWARGVWARLAQPASSNLALGIKLMHAGHLREAVFRFRLVRWLQPDDAASWWYLNQCYRELGQKEEAKKALHRALALLHALSLPRPWSEQEFAALLAQPGTRVTGTADGFLLTRKAADEAEILTLAVHPARRRLGIASALLTHWLEMLPRAGVKAAFLEVNAGNRAAIALYTKCGFAETARRPGYYPTPTGNEDAIVMRREIAG